MDKETQRALKKLNKRVWHDDNQRDFVDFIYASEWSITLFGHTYQAKLSGDDLMPINSKFPILSITIWYEEQGAQIEISAELPTFTRVTEVSA